MTLSEIAVRSVLDEGRVSRQGGHRPLSRGKVVILMRPLSLGSASLDEGNDLAVTLRQYAYMVVKRRWLILGIALAFFVLGGVRILLQTPLYTATVRIQIEREAAKIVEGGTTSPVETGSTDFLRTQYELLKSRSMAERVVSTLHLYDDESFLQATGCFGASAF